MRSIHLCKCVDPGMRSIHLCKCVDPGMRSIHLCKCVDPGMRSIHLCKCVDPGMRSIHLCKCVDPGIRYLVLYRLHYYYKPFLDHLLKGGTGLEWLQYDQLIFTLVRRTVPEQFCSALECVNTLLHSMQYKQCWKGEGRWD